MNFRLFSKKPTTYPRWLDSLALLSAACVFLLLLVPLLGTDSAYFDEGYSAYLARFNPLEIAQYTALDVHPPLYYVVLHYWSLLFGDSIFILRLLSVIFGLIAIFFAFLAVRTSFGQKAAYSVLLFTTLSPLFLRYSEAMRMYSMVIAIAMAATYVLIRLLACNGTHRNRWLWLVYAMLVSAGMWTNYFTALVWLSHIVWLLYEYRRNQQSKIRIDMHFLRSWAIAVGGAVILYIPWIPLLLVRFTDVQGTGFWIKPLSVDTLASTVTMGLTFTTALKTEKWLLVLVIAFIVSSLVVGRIAYKQMNSRQKQSYRLLLATSTLPVVFLAIMSLPPLQSSFVYRYALVAVFASLIVVGISLAVAAFGRFNTAKKTVLYIGATAVLAIGVANMSLAGNRSLDTGKKSMVSQILTRINDTSRPGSPIIVRSPYTYYAAAVYERDSHPIYYDHSAKDLKLIGSTKMLYDNHFERGLDNINLFTAKNKRVWMVAEDPWNTRKPTSADWKKADSFIVKDNGKPTGYAVEYTLQ